ncbi:hypothetical protein Dimus_005428 [Dionaea muscipula]
MFGADGSDDQVTQWARNPMAVDRRWKANIEVAPNCPRCASTNTKFCYYNNYSLSQPRYFCKGCRRYWTKGGALRSVPVGGGCRKSRRAKPTKQSPPPPPSPSSSPNYSHEAASSSGCQLDSEKSSSNDSNGVDIDLAAVFARFLHQNSGPCLSADDTTEPLHQLGSFEQTYHLNQNQSVQMFPDPGLTPDINHHHQQEEDQTHQGIDTSAGDCVAYSFDQVVQDDFWLDISNFNSWQPIAELQELDDQFKNSSNQSIYGGDNWSLLDQTPYDILSRPPQC